MVTIAYTRGGDRGETSLFGGSRLMKSSLFIDCCGAIDELNSYIGVCRNYCGKKESDTLENVQKQLLDIGADLNGFKKINRSYLDSLEMTIDSINVKLPTLKHFILPFGTESASHLHFARTICRMAERKIVRLSELRGINPLIVPYVNRLSSLLFVLARYENFKKKIKEVEWHSN